LLLQKKMKKFAADTIRANTKAILNVKISSITMDISPPHYHSYQRNAIFFGNIIFLQSGQGPKVATSGS
jgi:hypothetical protein